MDFRKEYRVEPGKGFKIERADPGDTAGYKSKEEAREKLAENRAKLAELQHKLFAEGKQALLVVLQAMDAGGKDGTIRHVMRGVNPQGCRVTSFRAPSDEELAHDFLWRIHKAVPAKGMIGIFNRSHYEDVLVVRVHDIVPKKVWSRRYDMINDFEKMLGRNGVTIIKFYLHISKQEQKARFQDRIEKPEKHWKVNPKDFDERKHWDDYMQAFEDAIEKCSTRYAPWYVIPSDKKWFRNLAISRIIADTLEDMDLRFPEPSCDVTELVIPD
ncbi:MAG: polyphosphate kinase 2 family protein [Deltaproteobacteria bacterium]|nr:polyphosphate kinase 2 family protein [Deltaproteobacteria bacterium]